MGGKRQEVGGKRQKIRGKQKEGRTSIGEARKRRNRLKERRNRLKEICLPHPSFSSKDQNYPSWAKGKSEFTLPNQPSQLRLLLVHPFLLPHQISVCIGTRPMIFFFSFRFDCLFFFSFLFNLSLSINSLSSPPCHQRRHAYTLSRKAQHAWIFCTWTWARSRPEFCSYWTMYALGVEAAAMLIRCFLRTAVCWAEQGWVEWVALRFFARQACIETKSYTKISIVFPKMLGPSDFLFFLFNMYYSLFFCWFYLLSRETIHIWYLPPQMASAGWPGSSRIEEELSSYSEPAPEVCCSGPHPASQHHCHQQAWMARPNRGRRQVAKRLPKAVRYLRQKQLCHYGIKYINA